MMDLRNKRVVVVGLGTSGLDASMLLSNAGAIVSATDSSDNVLIRANAERLKEKYIPFEIGSHSESFMKGADIIVLSPGVSKESIPVKYAMRNFIPIISELELGFQFITAPIAAVTGTNGKSTVVSLIGEMLKAQGKNPNVCGNIGNSISGEVPNIGPNTACVVEVSSFQLEWIVDFRPKISCILNITEDHLDRYASFDEYKNTKFKIFSRQRNKDFIVLNHDDKAIKALDIKFQAKRFFYSMHDEVDGLYLDNEKVIFKKGKIKKILFELPEANLKGDYNKENILAATLVSYLMGMDPDIIRLAISNFKGLEHRNQVILKKNGITFIDDSKATNIDAAKRALSAVRGKAILIAGGRDKGADYRIISDEIKSKVKGMVLIGEAAPLIEKAFKDMVPIKKAQTLDEAALIAYQLAEKDDTVLLSPMCSSFDMFRDYKDRGNVFRRAVKSLK